MKLRPHQTEAIVDARKSYAAKKNPIIVLPTGGGKTLTATLGMIKPMIENGKRVLWIAHLRELLTQAGGAAAKHGIRHGYVCPGLDAAPGASLQIASIQTLARREWPDVDIVFVDECHHVRSATYGRVLAHYQDRGAWTVGLTATPKRLDGRGLGRFFDEIIEPTTTRELIELGYLSEFRYFAPFVPDLSGVPTTAGDFNQGGIAGAMNTSRIVGDIVKNYREHGEGRKALVFAAGVAHSKALVNEFKMKGIVAEHLDGATPHREREKIFGRFARGEIKVLSNAALFFEGVDVPDIGCVIVARPTKSLVIHKQSIGRGLRAVAGKKDCIIFDHAGNWERNGLPDDIVEWSLDEKEAKPDTPKVKRCDACFAIVKPGTDRCPQCGTVFVKQPKAGPAQVDGKLEEVKQSKPTPEAKSEFYETVLMQAEALGNRAGWAAHRFRAEFKVWPRTSRGFPAAKIKKRVFDSCRHRKIGPDGCVFCGRDDLD